jgi:hypothetical protein
VASAVTPRDITRYSQGGRKVHPHSVLDHIFTHHQGDSVLFVGRVNAVQRAMPAYEPVAEKYSVLPSEEIVSSSSLLDTAVAEPDHCSAQVDEPRVVRGVQECSSHSRFAGT